MTSDSAIPTPPADDGAIDQALAGLDAALADWATAMTEAQAALNVVDESPGPAPAPGPRGSWLPQEIATDPRFADPTPMFGDDPLPDDEPVDPPQAATTPVGAPEGGKVVKPFVDPDARREACSTAAAAADLSRVEETLSEEDADALMMAALDPATAYAIRMRRRMTDRKLSLAELMDGLWPSDESVKADAKKSKKWWKRRESDR